MVEILVVDDNLQLRDTLRTILNKRPGVEATRRIRALLPDTVIIGMSCHNSREVETALRAVGAHAFLPKELVPEKIFDVIAQQLPQDQPVP